MKPLLVVLMGVHLNGPPKIVSDAQAGPVTDSAQSLDTQQARQTVVDFLVWYKNHYLTANRYVLVNQRVDKPYSVNLKNAERYLTYLNTSHLLPTLTWTDGGRFSGSATRLFGLIHNTKAHPADSSSI